ncbi:hypothetical protein VNI00_007943 [Paramarasmius palmivorus]|uniref:G-protein coupled receptors family 1 profile domain-containing protein n=1 Tax=Paramarasmius palmivorus TaxID=297713 RepID=A0AAW0CXV7_9AGAR
MPGVIAVNVFAILSSIALLTIIIRGIWLAVLRLCGRSISQYRDYIFFNTQLGYYAACLLIANSFNSVAGLMGLPFLIQRGISEDGLCIAQAVVMQFGNIATAYFTVAIGVHTFNSLVLRKRQSVFFYAPAIFLGWALAVVIAILPIMVDIGPIYGVSGLACGVKQTYGSSMFFFHLLPIFIAAGLSAILYTLIFLVLRGSLVIKGGVKLSTDSNDRGGSSSENYQRFVAGIAKSMIWYPAAYIIFLVPYSVTRLLGLAGMEIPFEAAVLAFDLTVGVANALLLFNTHRVLTPAIVARNTTQSKQSKRETDMSFGTADTFKRLTTVSAMPIHYNLTEKMINEYRAGYPTISPTTDTSSDRRLLFGDNRSMNSYFTSDVAGMPRNISPVAQLNERLDTHPETSTAKAVPMTEHARNESTDTLSSLPPPPRRLRTPPAALQPLNAYRTSSASVDLRSNSPSLRTQSPVSLTSTRPPRMSALQHNRASSVYSSASVELDVSGWLARQNPDGTMPSGLRNQPMLSAVQPSFPGPIADPSTPPSARLRPLLLASVERTGSPTLAQHYHRLYSNSPTTTSPQ